MSSVGGRIVHPPDPWPMGSYEKKRRSADERDRERREREHERAEPAHRQRDQRADERGERGTDRATAHTKLSCPCDAINGMSTPQSRSSAQPAAKPPAVTNVAWRRLTIPPMPVTTTNERNTIPTASPEAMSDDS